MVPKWWPDSNSLELKGFDLPGNHAKVKRKNLHLKNTPFQSAHKNLPEPHYTIEFALRPMQRMKSSLVYFLIELYRGNRE